MNFTYMRILKNASAIILLFLLFACKNRASEEQVRKSASRSNEMNIKYINDQKEKYTKALEKQIKILEKDIDKLQSVSDDGRKSAGSEINSSLNKLIADKAEAENRLKALQFKSEQVARGFEMNYNKYNYALDSILRDVNTFLTTYKIDAEAEKSR